MAPADPRGVAVFLAEHSAWYRGVRPPEGEEGTQLDLLARAACTINPGQKLFGVTEGAILLSKDKLRKRHPVRRLRPKGGTARTYEK